MKRRETSIQGEHYIFVQKYVKMIEIMSINSAALTSLLRLGFNSKECSIQ